MLAFIHFYLYCWIFSSDNNGARLKAVTASNVVFHFCITLTDTQNGCCVEIKKIIYRGRYLNLIWLQLSARYLSTIRSIPLSNILDDRERGTSCSSAKKSNIRKVLLASSGQSIGRDPSAIPIVNVIANLTLCACWWHTWYLSFFYTHTFSGLKILHSKVHKFATKQRKSILGSKIHFYTCKITLRVKLITLCKISPCV